MPRFKDYDYNQMKMILLSFDRQILPGSFEYSLCYLVDHEIDQKYSITVMLMTITAARLMIRRYF